MRRLAILWLLAWVVSPCSAATPVTAAELRNLLTSATAQRRTDREIVLQLSSVDLTERLDPNALPGGLGPITLETLRVMADESAFLPPPEDLILRDEAPSRQEQVTLLLRARDYTHSYIRNLPDFICIRATKRYDDQPFAALRIYKGLRVHDFTSSELTFSHGEESDAPRLVDRPVSGSIPEGLTSYGEFGSIIGALFVQSGGIEMKWSHWELLNGRRAAVFLYSVDTAHSRYTLTWCCQGHGEARKPRQVKTAYSGEIAVDPDSGAILRIVRRAAPPRGFPAHRTDTMVEYRAVEIGGRTYTCPARSVLVSEARAAGSGFRPILHYLNEGQFSDYRKFVTSAALHIGAPGPDAVTPPSPQVASAPGSDRAGGSPAVAAPTPAQVALTKPVPVRLLVKQPETFTFQHIRFSPNGQYALAQDGSSIIVLTVQPLAVAFRIAAENAGLAEFTPDSQDVVLVNSATRADARSIAFVGRPASVERWSVADGTRVQSNEVGSRPCESQGLSPDGTILVCVDFRGTLSVTDVSSSRPIFEKERFGVPLYPYDTSVPLSMMDYGLATIEFSPDSHFVIVSPASHYGNVLALDLRPLRVVKLAGALKGLHDTRFLFVGPDRLLMTGTHFGLRKETPFQVLVSFPSGEVISAPALPSGCLSRAADPNTILVFPCPAGQWLGTAPLPGVLTLASSASLLFRPESVKAVDLITGGVITTGTPALDVLGDRYLIERLPGQLELRARKGGDLLATLILKVPGQVTRAAQRMKATGQVVAVAKDRMTLSANDGREITFQLAADTSFLDGEKAIPPEKIAAGAYVDVISTPTQDEGFDAVSVRLWEPTVAAARVPETTASREPEPGSPDPHPEFLAQALRMALEAAGKLPPFTCSAEVKRALSFDREGTTWVPHDVTSAAIVWVGGQEQYRNVTIDGRQADPRELRGRSWSTEEFRAALAEVAAAPAAHIQYAGEVKLGRHQAVKYSFYIDSEHSRWVVREGSQAIRPARSGTIWFDQATKRALRIEFQGLDLPREFPVESMRVAADYDSVRFGRETYLAPAHGELIGCRRNPGGTTWCTKDSIDFGSYRRFGGE